MGNSLGQLVVLVGPSPVLSGTQSASRSNRETLKLRLSVNNTRGLQVVQW